jgi:glycosyltransferase involved in cell wall biosynthesis
VPSPVKVCYVVDSGTAVWVVEQLRALRDRYGCEVVACVFRDRGRLLDGLRAEGIPAHVCLVSGTGVAALWAFPLMVLRLARLFRRERVDVVQTHLFRSMVIGRLAGWLADVPVRLAMIAGPAHLEARVTRWIDRATCWMDVAIIASSEYSRGLYRRMGIPDARLELIYYGMDERRFDPERCRPAALREEFGWPADTPLIGMVAQFYHPTRRTGRTPPVLHGRAIKGHEDLIRAMPAVLREFPRAKLVLIGGPVVDAGRALVEELKALVRRLGLDDSVRFTGFRTDVPACLRALDVSVQPSLLDNLGGTGESLLMERPLVATRVGGLVESVRDGETGLLAEPANPDDLARAIRELLRDPERARRLGRAGRVLMLERFTLSHTVRALGELYARLTSGPRRGYRPRVSACRLFALVPLSVVLAARVMAETLAFRILDAWPSRGRRA